MFAFYCPLFLLKCGIIVKPDVSGLALVGSKKIFITDINIFTLSLKLRNPNVSWTGA